MLKYKEISLNPTPFTVKVFYSEDPAAMARKFKKLFLVEGLDWHKYFRNARKGCDGFCHEFKSTDGQEIVMCLFNINPGLVAHEALHITWYLNKFAGMEYSFNSQETQAYYIQYLVDEILKMK